MRPIEREAELSRLNYALESAAAETGTLLVISGPPGIGKTTLLNEAGRVARDRGIGVLSARASELEVDVPFGVVRMMFEPALAAVSPAERKSLLTGVAGGVAAALELLPPGMIQPPAVAAFDRSAEPVDIPRGLFWLIAGLAERAALLITVDDVQWCDAPSLRFLGYLAHRLDDLPVALVVATRGGRQEGESAVLGEFTTSGEVIALAPLSPAGTRQLVRRRLSREADESFCDACHAATGGNPFLLAELVAQLLADGSGTTAIDAGRVASLRPTRIARMVGARLRRMGAEATQVAQAAAVLGDGASLRWVARLADLPDAAAADAVDGLVDVGMLSYAGTIEFAHPLTRGAVHDGIAPARRGLMHATAGRGVAHHSRGAVPRGGHGRSSGRARGGVALPTARSR
jgi:predicted ATPase